MLELVFTILAILLIFVFAVSLFYVFPWIFGAAYEGTSKEKIEDIIKISGIKKGKVVDLGSGDGRIVIAFAKKGFTAHGYEINPLLVLFSRWKIKKAGLEKKAFIHWNSFWKVNLSKYDLIILFQFKTIMRRLGKKLERELKPNAKIVSFYWKFPNLKLIKNNKNIYLYKLKN